MLLHIFKLQLQRIWSYACT